MTRRLRRVQPYVSPGFTRRSNQFVAASRRRVTHDDRARAASLAIPPAWTDVWIAHATNGHIQAVGVDAAGRRQYLYHPDWRESRDHAKFQRALGLAAVLPRARASVTRDLRREGLSRERVLAAAFRILDTVAVRVGNERYTATNGSRGLSTLQQRHAVVRGALVQLTFPAKSGRRARVEVQDHDLAKVLHALLSGKRTDRLLVPDNGDALTATDVNEYVRVKTGGDFSAKDFRTLRGTIVAAQHLARLATPTSERERRACTSSAALAASYALGNTLAVALSSYIDPEVFVHFEAGDVVDLHLSPEAGLLRLLRPRDARRD